LFEYSGINLKAPGGIMILQKIVSIGVFLSFVMVEPLFSETQQWVTGQVWFQEVQNEYSSGKFNEYLTLIDNIFNTPIFQQVFNEQRKNLKENLSQKGKVVELIQQFEKKANALNEQRNKQLLLLCKGHEGDLECQIVKNAVEGDESVKKQPSLTTLLEKRGFFDLSGKDKAASEFSDILLQGLYKQDIAQAFAYQNQDKTKPLPPEERDLLEKRKTALQIQMMEKFENFANTHSNNPLGEEARSMVQDFPKNAASKHDWSYLKALATKEIKAENPTQEKIGEVLRSYYADLEQLTKTTFQQALNP
jgi:hypothetical protein